MDSSISASSPSTLTLSLMPLVDEGGERLNVTATGNDVIKYISDEAAFYVNVIVYVGMCGVISILGIAANVINIIVFVRQGVFAESTNVSLMCLAVAELLSTITMLWLSVSFAVVLANPPGLIWDPYDVMYLTAGWPHVTCSLITRSITAFIAFERCFCVVFPFKVKRVFTPRRSFILVTCIFVYYIMSFGTAYVLIPFRRVTDPTTNETRIMLIPDPQWVLVEKVVTHSLNMFTLNILSASIVLICTTITVSRVKLSSAWRKSVVSTGKNNESNSNHDNDHIDDSVNQRVCESKPKEKASSNSNSISNKVANPKTKIDKEAKLVKMITLICVVFLICYSPNIAYMLLFAIDNEVRPIGIYKNLALVAFAISFLFESFNSSINIFLYYRMSSRFKKEFNILFGRDKDMDK